MCQLDQGHSMTDVKGKIIYIEDLASCRIDNIRRCYVLAKL